MSGSQSVAEHQIQPHESFVLPFRFATRCSILCAHHGYMTIPLPFSPSAEHGQAQRCMGMLSCRQRRLLRRTINSPSLTSSRTSTSSFTTLSPLGPFPRPLATTRLRTQQ